MNIKELAEALKLLSKLDEFKNIKRHTLVKGRKLRENDAEHTWHLAMWALIILPLLKRKYNSEKILKMILIHDLPEIYSGDVLTFKKDHNHKKEEIKGAGKIFGMFPKKISKDYLNLLLEMEKGKTKEAKLVKAMDKLQPILQNINTKGKLWKKLKIDFNKIDNHKRSHMEFDKEIFLIYKNLMGKAKKYLNND